MSTNPEVWISPEGEEVALNCLGDKGFNDWYPEEPGQRHPMRYAMVNEAGQDVYAFTVFPLEQWVRRGHVRTYSDEQVELFDVLKRVQEG